MESKVKQKSFTEKKKGINLKRTSRGEEKKTGTAGDLIANNKHKDTTGGEARSDGAFLTRGRSRCAGRGAGISN